MKLKRWGILLLLLFSFAAKAGEDPIRLTNNSPNVVVSITPFYGLVAAVMKGIGTPQLLVKAGASPHHYALKVSEITLLQKADVIFWGGPALETFLIKPLQNLVRQYPVPVVIQLDKTPGLLLRPLRQHFPWESHHHAEVSKEAVAVDMHFWLDPTNAIPLIERIVKTLVMMDPLHADQYYQNGKQLKKRLKQLDAHISSMLKEVASVPYMVFHDAYQYFEKRYKLNGVGAISVHPELPVSVSRFKMIRALIQEKKVRCVFTEPQFPPKLVHNVIQNLEVHTNALDPEGQELHKNEDGYFQLLENLSTTMQQCLSSHPKQK